MRKAPPGGNGRGSGVSKSSKHPYNTPADSSQTAAADWPSFIEVPAKYVTAFYTPSSDKPDVCAVWLSLARRGIILPRPPGIIIMRGGRA